jgi:hypothetical protein
MFKQVAPADLPAEKRPTCQECGCQTGGGQYCYEHVPYMVWPKKDGSFLSDRGGRLRYWFDDLARAPAEERETPVEGCINCGESNDGGYMSGFEGDADEGAVGPFCSQCWELMRETFTPRPAEDRAVPLTKGEQYATDEEGHRGTGTPDEEVAQEVRRSQEGDSSLSEHHCQGSRADREVAAEDRAVTAPQEPELVDALVRGHGDGQEHTIADVNAGRIDDLIAPRLERERERYSRELDEREAACCPEDVGFEEWIRVLTSQRDEAQKAAAQWRDGLAAAKVKLAALTHAIEALRGEYANRQPGTVSSDSIFADKLAAILKGTKTES